MIHNVNFDFINEVRRDQLAKSKTVNKFDSASGDAATAVASIDDKAFDSELLALRCAALFAVFQLSDDILSDDLDDNELPSDRLDAYLHNLNDSENEDEENAQLDEQIMQVKAANMADAMLSLNVEEEIVRKAFGPDIDEADEAIENLAEIIEVNIPAGDALDQFIQAFLYGENDLDMTAGEADEYDSAELGKSKLRKTKSGQTLVYKGVKAVRNGKITIVNKRVGNTGIKVKLSPKQKNALRKALSKAVTPNALKKRMKSLRLGIKNQIYN